MGTFEQTFASSAGFTFDSEKTEFSAGVMGQIDLRPADAIFFTNFEDLATKTNPEDGNWGEGTLTGTLNGSASVSGGELDLTGGNANVEWNVDNLATMIQTGCVRILWKPNYTGNAPAVQELFQSNSSTTNRVHVRHNSNLIQCYVYNSSGALLFNISFAWTPSTIKYYEIELNFDCTGGVARVFIDGQLQDSDSNTGTRTSNNLFRVGASSGMNSYIDSVLIFDTVQHTSNYSPGASVSGTIYGEDTVTFPEFEYLGPEELVLLNSLTTTESGLGRYQVQVGRSGNWLYWSGSAWVVGIDDYSQATTESDFSANIGSIPVSGQVYLQIKFFYEDSNTKTSISNFLVVYTGPEETPSTTKVYGWTYNADGTPSTSSFTIQLVRDFVEYSGPNQVRNSPVITVTPDAEGYWEQALMDTESMEAGAYYIFTFSSRTKNVVVPLQEWADFNDLEVFST